MRVLTDADRLRVRRFEGKRRQLVGTRREGPKARGYADRSSAGWWEKFVVRSGLPALAIRTAHVRALAGLPDLHQDPFDRILVAQPLAEQFTLASKDDILARYGAPVIWD